MASIPALSPHRHDKEIEFDDKFENAGAQMVEGGCKQGPHIESWGTYGRDRALTKKLDVINSNKQEFNMGTRTTLPSPGFHKKRLDTMLQERVPEDSVQGTNQATGAQRLPAMRRHFQ